MSLESHYQRFCKLTGNEVAAAILAVGAALIEQRPDNLLTPKQAAAKLGVSSDKVYELCSTGNLRSRKIGRAVRIEPRDLDHYCDDAA